MRKQALLAVFLMPDAPSDSKHETHDGYGAAEAGPGLNEVHQMTA